MLIERKSVVVCKQLRNDQQYCESKRHHELTAIYTLVAKHFV